MTREEQINEAVETYINGLFEDGIEIPIEDYENIGEGFVAGAKWADKHPNLERLWHDASEEPNIDEDVVLFDSCGNFVTEFYNGDVTWNNIVLFHKATMWAYEDDLLTKEVRNEND